MNDYQTFWEAVRNDPADKTTALVFADWLEENMDRTRHQALRRVAKVRRDERNQREKEAATKLLAEGSELREQLLIEMMLECNEWEGTDNVSTVIVSGSRPPYVQAAGYPFVDGAPQLSIVVGARWVLLQARFDALRREVFKATFGHPEPGAPAE